MEKKRVPKLRPNNKERAASMVETIFVVPFLILLIGFTLDLGYIILSSFKLNNIAHQAARYGAKINGLETAVTEIGELCRTTAASAACCIPDTNCVMPSAPNSAQLAIITVQAYNLLSNTRFHTKIINNSYNVKAKFDAPNDTVEVQVSAYLQLPVGLILRSFQVSSSSSAPYLY
jgi:Flp pilus assembly protein TadG